MWLIQPEFGLRSLNIKGWKMEEGGWKSLLVIDIENLCKIKLGKKDDHLLLITFRASLFPLPSPKLYTSKILIPN